MPDIPVLHLDGFDGPMDVLLDLAERQLIDFGRMSILALAEQFVAAMERLAECVTLEPRRVVDPGDAAGAAALEAAVPGHP